MNRKNHFIAMIICLLMGLNYIRLYLYSNIESTVKYLLVEGSVILLSLFILLLYNLIRKK